MIMVNSGYLDIENVPILIDMPKHDDVHDELFELPKYMKPKASKISTDSPYNRDDIFDLEGAGEEYGLVIFRIVQL